MTSNRATRAFFSLAKIQTPATQALAFKNGVLGKISGKGFIKLDQCLVCRKVEMLTFQRDDSTECYVVHCATSSCQEIATTILNAHLWYSSRNSCSIDISNPTFIQLLQHDIQMEKDAEKRKKLESEIKVSSNNISSDQDTNVTALDDLDGARFSQFIENRPKYVKIEEPVTTVETSSVPDEDQEWIEVLKS